MPPVAVRCTGRGTRQHRRRSLAVTWRAAFGRPLDYYTGLVFEVTVGGSPAVLAGGGRFDRMMTLLGAADNIPAVGFSLWLDRIEQALAQCEGG